MKKSSTFVIEIKSNEYNTWQGNIKWIEGKRIESFRSVLELVKLMDSAVEKDGNDETSETI